MSSLENITREVAETKDAVSSAVLALSALSTKLAEAIAANKAGDDGAALDALAADLDASQQALAAAIAATAPAVDPEVDPVIDPVDGDQAV